MHNEVLVEWRIWSDPGLTISAILLSSEPKTIRIYKYHSYWDLIISRTPLCKPEQSPAILDAFVAHFIYLSINHAKEWKPAIKLRESISSPRVNVRRVPLPFDKQEAATYQA